MIGAFVAGAAFVIGAPIFVFGTVLHLLSVRGILFGDAFTALLSRWFFFGRALLVSRGS